MKNLQYSETIDADTLWAYRLAAGLLSGVNVEVAKQAPADKVRDRVGVVVTRACNRTGQFSEFSGLVERVLAEELAMQDAARSFPGAIVTSDPPVITNQQVPEQRIN